MDDRVLLEFENIVEHEGRAYSARAVGEGRDDGLWEGWIEFTSADGTVATERETTQPNRETLKYWATGLTHAYLEGALDRALGAPGGLDQRWDTPLHAGRETVARDHTHVATPAPRAILDPFAVYAEGRDLLRDQLGALHADQLRNIVRHYGIASTGAAAELTDWEMRALILQAAERQAGG
jgi:hypothetical protein